MTEGFKIFEGITAKTQLTLNYLGTFRPYALYVRRIRVGIILRRLV